MVKLVDLDEDDLDALKLHHRSDHHQADLAWQADDRPNLNHSLKLSVVLSCYP